MPNAYLILKTEAAGVEHWTHGFLRSCMALGETYSFDMIDEKLWSEAGDIAGIVIKISGPDAHGALAAILPGLLNDCPSQTSVRLVRAVEGVQSDLKPAEFEVEFFRKEFAADSQMVHHVDSCVQLIHRATGTAARSTCHRSQAKNQEEALLLMRSVLAGGYAIRLSR